MTHKQNQALWRAILNYAHAVAAAEARGEVSLDPGVRETLMTSVHQVVEEIEAAAGKEISKIEEVLDFLRDDFGEFLLIARFAHKDAGYAVVACEDGDHPLDALAGPERLPAAGLRAAAERWLAGQMGDIKDAAADYDEATRG